MHDELPTERMYRAGGPSHAVQLWVNLPGAQDDAAALPVDHVATRRLLTSDDGGALIRLIAGDIAGFTGPGVTHTPITYARDARPGRGLRPVESGVQRLAYVLTGRGTAGPKADPSRTANSSSSAPATTSWSRPPTGRPSRSTCSCWAGSRSAPIAHYGPFVMNTREEILQAIDDYQAGRLGIVPADQLAPRNFA